MWREVDGGAAGLAARKYASADPLSERDQLCGTGWIAHEQQRISAACTLRRSFGWEWQGAWNERDEFCTDFLRILSGRSVFLYGDSLVRQQFHQLMCTCRTYAQLHTASHAYWRCNATTKKGIGCSGNATSISMLDKSSGNNVRLHWAFTTGEWLQDRRGWLHALPHLLQDDSVWLKRMRHADVLIFGVGAWMVGDEGAWSQSLWRWSDVLRSHVRHKGKSVWLEYFAGHFATPSSDWSMAAKAANSCAPLNYSAAERWPGRVAAVRWAHESGTPTWPVAEVSAPRHDDHPGSLGLDTKLWIGGLPVSIMFDCRHFCFPGSTLEARNHELLRLLKSLPLPVRPPAALGTAIHAFDG